MRIARSFPIVLAVLSIGCRSPIDPGAGRVVGTIDAGQTFPDVIDAPAEVSSGQFFTVSDYQSGFVTVERALVVKQ